MSTPAEDKDLEEYLRRKSALSLGYKKLYLEAPPEELDRAIAARARRALRWLVPGILAAVIALGIFVGVSVGVNDFVDVAVKAEKNAARIRADNEAELARQRASQPIAVMIDANNLAKQEAKEAADKQKAELAAREQALAKIDALQRAGKQQEADAELRRFQQAYPDSKK